jgi:hypothetical protein
MNNREMDLIQKSIDGTLSRREESRLQRLLDEDTNFRTAYRSHVAVTDALGRVRAVDPPAELQHSVMNSIDRYRYRRSASAPSVASPLARFLAAVRNAITVKYVAGVATGALATCLLLAIAYQWPSVDSSDARGAIGGSVLPGHANAIDHRDFSFMGGSGYLDLSGDDEQLYAELRVESSEPVVINVQFADGSASIVRIDQDKAGSSRIAIDRNRAVIAQGASRQYNITAQRVAADMTGFTFSIDNPAGTQLYSLPDVIVENHEGTK